MKKPIGNNLYALYICLSLLLIPIGLYADEGNILDRKITIAPGKGTKYQLLRQLSDKTGYQFVYDSSVIDNDKEISIAEKEYVLQDAIYAIAETRQINIKVIGNHIALTASVVRKEKVIPSLPIPEKPPYTIITGKTFDLYSKEMIPSATISIEPSGFGTISNQNGVFRLSIPDSLRNNSVRVSHVGYESREFIPAELYESQIDIALEPKVIPLQEVVIRVVNPRQVLTQLLDNRSRNYATRPSNLTAFYREGIEHKKRNIDLSEAVLQVYKTGYQHESVSDQVKVVKMRRIIDQQEKDTILTKVKSGINSVLLLDVIKYVPDFLDDANWNGFDYAHTDISVTNDRLVNVISFNPKKYLKEPLFKGELYVDAENHALLEARFEINPEYVEKATDAFVEKKSKHFKLALRKAVYTVSYKPSANGLHYMNHVRGDLEFRVRRKRQWFSSTLKVWFEMVNCKTDTENVRPIPKSERLSPRTIFSETKHPYDPDFWGNFNVIVPEEELKGLILNNLTEVIGENE